MSKGKIQPYRYKIETKSGFIAAEYHDLETSKAIADIVVSNRKEDVFVMDTLSRDRIVYTAYYDKPEWIVDRRTR